MGHVLSTSECCVDTSRETGGTDEGSLSEGDYTRMLQELLVTINMEVQVALTTEREHADTSGRRKPEVRKELSRVKTQSSEEETEKDVLSRRDYTIILWELLIAIYALLAVLLALHLQEKK